MGRAEPDPTLAPGEMATLVVALRNTGYRGWYQGSPGQQVNIATASPLDVARPELAANWLSEDAGVFWTFTVR